MIFERLLLLSVPMCDIDILIKHEKKTIAAVFSSFSFPLNFVAVLAQWTPLSFRRYGANDTFDV